MDRFIAENWTVLQRAARKCTNGHKLPSESSSPKAAALGEKHIKLPQVRAVSSNRDFALMLPLSYNRIAFVPTWRLCIVEVHFMGVESAKPRHPDPRAEIGQERLPGASGRSRLPVNCAGLERLVCLATYMAASAALSRLSLVAPSSG
jgi:hypothetical protein